MPNFVGNKISAYVAEGAETKSGGWYLDSGATYHVTNDLNNLSISSEHKGNHKLAVGNGSKLEIISVGYTLIGTLEPAIQKYIKLNHILFVP